jgi:hypothetical protein
MKGLALFLLVACAPARMSLAGEDLAARVLELRERVAAGSASANERFELAGHLWRAGREDLARPLAEELTADPHLAPWAHYLVGQFRFQGDPLAAREAFLRARDAAILRGEAGAGLVRSAEVAIADSEREAERPGRVRESASRITRGLWITSGLWALMIGVASWLTRTRADEARSRRAPPRRPTEPRAESPIGR